MERLPTHEQIWHERLSRALDERDEFGTPRRIWDPELRDLIHKVLAIESNAERLMSRVELEGEGVRRPRVTWTPNPFHGDRADVERGVAWVWDEIGKLVGIGPRPTPAQPVAARWR